MALLPSWQTAFQVFGGLAAAGFASLCILLYKYQTSLIYPSSLPSGSRTHVETPERFGIPYENLKLRTPDGLIIRAYLMMQDGKAGAKAMGVGSGDGEIEEKKIMDLEEEEKEKKAADDYARRRPTVLFFHANAGNMGHRLPLASVFYKRFGCNVFMLSYRGYGISEGEPSEKGIRIDAQTALDYILDHPVLKETIIIAYSQSIGGAVAIDLASKNPDRIHALIVENTFLSIPELIPHALPPLKHLTFLCREIWPSGESIKLIPPSVPILFLSGRKDELIPPWMMRELYRRSRSKRKVWKEFRDGTHNDTCVKPGYFDQIGMFLQKHVLGGEKTDDEEPIVDPDLADGVEDELEGVEAGSRVV